MKVKPLKPRLHKYLIIHGLVKKFNKQVVLLSNNPKHPSLNTEVLEPKRMRIYSFRIDRKYRAIFVVQAEQILIIDINDHYQ